jgi:uncharacterized phage infection (PIP) family protein YhgE
MDRLVGLGMRIDEHEQLKIVAENVEQGSQALTTKCRQLLETLESLSERLAKTETLLATALEQSDRTKVVGLAAGITNRQHGS